MNPDTAERFAQEWIAAWNSHDLERILSLYADGIRLTSPIAARLTGSAEIRGKAALRRYFAQGLACYPDLHFRLLGVFPGCRSLVLHYANQAGTLAAEYMVLDRRLRVVRMVAHYRNRE